MDKNLSERYLAAKRALFDKAYASLNEMQRRAVFTTEGPLLVLAGAGSGKTTVLVHRIAYIIRYGNAYYSNAVPYGLTEAHVADLENAVHLTREEIVNILPEFITDPCPPYRVLAITFTNKAAREIKTRLMERLEDETLAGDVWSGTFHSVCMRILRTKGDLIGYDPAKFTIYDMDDVKKTITAIMKRLNIDDKQLPVRSVMTAISRAKDQLESPEDFEIRAGVDFRMSRIARIYSAYAEEMMRSNAVDFDDIIMQTVRLLREHDEVREYYQKKFRYVCIDEYQDTNGAQFELASLLSGGYRNLMVVGDDDQSIYRFRGATIENILGFDQEYSDATVIKLEQNYRSTKNILDAANGVIANNTGRHDKTLWTSSDEGARITLKKTEDQIAEARAVVDTIHRMISESGGKRSYRDFAVLYRINAQSSNVEYALRKSGMPYRLVCGTRFNDRKEIRDAAAYFQLITNHADRERLLRIINEPRRKIGQKTLDAVSEIAVEQGCTLFEVMENADRYVALQRSAATLKAFTDMIHRLSSLAETLSLADLFDEVMEQSGYMRMLREAGEEEQERIENLMQLKSNMMEYEQNAEERVSLVSFLEEYALVADVDKYDDSADAIVLMTIHSAKGLEFPVVFIPGMEDGIFPGMQNIMGSPEDMEEERRLAYVAITRAKEQLIILHARTRKWQGQTMTNQISRFVSEIPASLLDKEDLTFEAAQRMGGGMGDSASFQPRPFYAERARQGRAPAYSDRITVGKPITPVQSSADRAAVQSLEIGDRVTHATFGQGEILSVKPMGADKLIEVVFDSVGTKKLMGTYAKLKRVDD